MKKRLFLIIAVLLVVVVFIMLFGSFLYTGNTHTSAKAANNQADERIILFSAPQMGTIKINFQDSAVATPVGWIKDFGLPFAAKPGFFEVSALQYGWKKREDGTPLNLTGNSRNRDNPDDVLLEGLIHMQANDIGLRYGPFKGARVEGYWEIKMLNGYYDVVVTVGDGLVGKAKEKDCINVEGVKAIVNFVPYGKEGSFGRFKTVKTRVKVTDGLLTVDADGGINTKINNIQITPVKLYPYFYLGVVTPNLLITKQDTSNHKLYLNINNSASTNINYQLHVKYINGATGWLHLIADNGKLKNGLVFDYTNARNLPSGSYVVKLSVSLPGYNSQELVCKLRVIDVSKPYVVSSNPINGANSVDINTSNIAANSLSVPLVKGFKGGIDNSTITNQTVKLWKEANGNYTSVKGVMQGTGGGDAISFSPAGPLAPNTHYKFIISSGVKSYAGASIQDFESDFYTGTTVADSSKIYKAEFIKKAIPGTQNKNYTTLTFGPDGKFYALRMDGVIERYEVNHADGSLINQKMINTLKEKYGERTAIGLTFDPSSTAQNLIAWVSHCSGGLTNAPAFDGNISRLAGPDLLVEELVIKKLPRSTRDHMVNGLAFGPDGALYICQGSNSSAGAFDKGWQREETLLAGSILRLDMAKLNKVSLPLDVETSPSQQLINKAPLNNAKMPDGKYNPYSDKSALTIYASGIRNAYDLVWHSNGQLYIPANGSGGGGNSPASVKGTRKPDGSFYNGPDIPATTSVQVQHDWLFRINPKLGVGYFGHPNPLRGEYVVNRGYADNPLYDKNIKPDKNYRGAAFDFGLNHSPNGVIEYKNNSFNGALKGKLLVCRFSGGGDIIVLEPGSLVKNADLKVGGNDKVYDIVNSARGSGNIGLTGMSGFANPLDIVEDTLTGNLYISEFNWNNNPNLISQITLLKVNDKLPKKYAQTPQLTHNSLAVTKH
jgi:glucose/arabinose dehydrogenase